MNKFGLFLLRLIGLKRAKPKTRAGKYMRHSEKAVIAGLLLYFALLAFPQGLFAHTVTHQRVTIFSRAPLPPESATRIAEMMDLVQRSELAVPGRTERIFVCDSQWLFRLFSPLSPHSFAISVPVVDNIFVSEADLVRNVARSGAPRYNQRSFTSVAAHEITHGLIRHRLGLWRGYWMRDWVAEGYCDYVAGESSFPEAEGLKMLTAGRSDPSRSFRYFTYRQMVRHLMDERKYSFRQVADAARDEEQVKAETIKALQEAASL